MGKGRGGGRGGGAGSSWHGHHPHGVGVAGAGAPARQHNHQVPGLEESTGFAWGKGGKSVSTQVSSHPPFSRLLKQTWFSAGSYFKAAVTKPPSHFPIRCGVLMQPRSPASQQQRQHRAAGPAAAPPQPPEQGRSAALTDIHAQVHTEIHILCPGIVGRLLAQHGEDAAVQVCLACCLVIAGDGDDGSPRAVPGHQVCRPARRTTGTG